MWPESTPTAIRYVVFVVVSTTFLLINTRNVEGTKSHGEYLFLSNDEQALYRERPGFEPDTWWSTELGQHRPRRRRHKHDKKVSEARNQQSVKGEIKTSDFSIDKRLTTQSFHGELESVTCDDKGDGREKKLARKCYSSLRAAMLKYSKLLKEEESDQKVQQFDICGHLEGIFSDCSSLMNHDVTKQCVSRDSSLSRKWKIFASLMEHFAKSCEKNTQDATQNKRAREMQTCMEEEYRGTLSIRCDEYFEFNVRQQTRGECFFLRERFKCHESLLESSCGRNSSEFIFNFLLIVAERHMNKLNCPIVPNDPDYEVFRYDTHGCRQGMIKRLEWCTATHLDGKFVLQFHPDNDLVAMGNAKHLTKLCKAYDGFTKCISPVKDSCPLGVSFFLQYESKLHQYILKMNFICSEHVYEAYSSNLDCLRSTVTERHLDVCEPHWGHLKPALDDIKSVDFFCLPDKPKVTKMTRELKELHSCHKNVFTDQCGQTAGDTIVSFFDLALSDPLYLRFGYKPNCSLHGFNSSQDAQLDLFQTHHRHHLHRYSSYDDDAEVSGATDERADDLNPEFVAPPLTLLPPLEGLGPTSYDGPTGDKTTGSPLISISNTPRVFNIDGSSDIVDGNMNARDALQPDSSTPTQIHPLSHSNRSPLLNHQKNSSLPLRAPATFVLAMLLLYSTFRFTL